MYNKYPYTDFSELNLDWFLEQFKLLVEEWRSTEEQWAVMQQNFQTLESTVQTFTTFVENYFENLDVQQEINNKLDQMALDGTLSDLLAPLVDDKLPGVVDTKLPAELATQLPAEVTSQLPGVVADQIGAAVAPGIPDAVTDWLDDHVNPVGSAVTIDDSLTIAGSAADAKVVGDKFDLVSDTMDANKIMKIYEPVFLMQGQINSSGVIGTGSHDLYVFPVSESDKVFVYNTTGFAYFATYPQSGDTAVDSTIHSGSNFTVISGAKYCVVRCNTGNTPEVISGSYIDSVIKKIKDTTGTVLENVTDYSTTTGYYVKTNGEPASSGSWNYYEFTSIVPGDVYEVDSFVGQSIRGWIFFDENDNVIGLSSYNGTQEQHQETVIVPSDAVMMIVNCKATENFTVKKIKAVTSTDLRNSNILYNKIFCAVGDSITYGDDIDPDGITQEGIEMYQYSDAQETWNRVTANFRHTWNYDIAERNGMILYNGGINGSTIQDNSGTSTKHPFARTNGRYTHLPENLDYLIIWFGWNDSTYGVVGTINDATNETFMGAYNVVLPYLINKYPYAKIGIVVPYMPNDTNAMTYSNAVHQIANKWGIGVFDIQKAGTPLYYRKDPDVGVDPAIVTARRATFQANGAHPNSRGHQYLSTMMEAWMRTL